MKLSVVMLTKNCAETVKKALLSAAGIADEFIIIDDFSTDETEKITKAFPGVKFYKRKLDDFASQRNFGADQCDGDWILMLDSDEYLTRDLAREIRSAVENPVYDTYDFRRRHIFLGKQIRYCDYNTYTSMPRIFKKGAGVFYKPVHETLDFKGETGFLEGWCLHDNARSFFEFTCKTVRYAQIEGKRLHQEGLAHRISSFFILHRMIKSFFKRFIRKQGFRDGIRGFYLCLLEAFHTAMIYGFYLEEGDKN